MDSFSHFLLKSEQPHRWSAGGAKTYLSYQLEPLKIGGEVLRYGPRPRPQSRAVAAQANHDHPQPDFDLVPTWFRPDT